MDHGGEGDGCRSGTGRGRGRKKSIDQFSLSNPAFRSELFGEGASARELHSVSEELFRQHMDDAIFGMNLTSSKTNESESEQNSTMSENPLEIVPSSDPDPNGETESQEEKEDNDALL